MGETDRYGGLADAEAAAALKADAGARADRRAGEFALVLAGRGDARGRAVRLLADVDAETAGYAEHLESLLAWADKFSDWPSEVGAQMGAAPLLQAALSERIGALVAERARIADAILALGPMPEDPLRALAEGFEAERAKDAAMAAELRKMQQDATGKLLEIRRDSHRKQRDLASRRW